MGYQQLNGRSEGQSNVSSVSVAFLFRSWKLHGLRHAMKPRWLKELRPTNGWPFGCKCVWKGYSCSQAALQMAALGKMIVEVYHSHFFPLRNSHLVALTSHSCSLKMSEKGIAASFFLGYELKWGSKWD
jgi:hypothetical protein